MKTYARIVWSFFRDRQWVPFIAAVVSLAGVVSDALVGTEFGWGAALPVVAAVAQWFGVYSRATHDDEISETVLDVLSLVGVTLTEDDVDIPE